MEIPKKEVDIVMVFGQIGALIIILLIITVSVIALLHIAFWLLFIPGNFLIEILIQKYHYKKEKIPWFSVIKVSILGPLYYPFLLFRVIFWRYF